MQKYSVVFDFGGVLLDWNPKLLYQSHFKTNEELALFLNGPFKQFNDLMDAGIAHIEALKNFPPDLQKMLSLYLEDFPKTFNGTFSEVEAILYKLHEQKYKIFGLTNWSHETFPWAKNHFKFMKLLSGIVVSGEEKVKKPNSKIYKTLSNRYNLNAENLIFIDDKLENVEAAKSLGWNGIHYLTPAQLKKDLETLIKL